MTNAAPLMGLSIAAVVLAAGTAAAQLELAGPLEFELQIVGQNNDGARSACAADFDGDGDIDFASVATDRNKIFWYENLGGTPPTFLEREIDTRGRPNYIRPADMNQDGRIDLITSSSVDDGITVYENRTGSPIVWRRRDLSVAADGVDGFNNEPRQCEAVDIDGDGDLDVVAVSVKDDSVTWYENQGAPLYGYTPHRVTSTYDGARAVYFGDFNGDGHMDILGGAWYDLDFSYFESDGQTPPSFTERKIFQGFVPEAGMWSVFSGDFDGDGDTDAAAVRRTGELEWYKNLGGNPPTWERIVLTDELRVCKAVQGADFDGDGDIDLISASMADDKIIWWENTDRSPTQFIEHIITQDPDDPGFGVGEDGIADAVRSVWPADVDLDGTPDIVWASRYSAYVAVYYTHPPLCAADVASPFGTLDIDDVLLFLDSFADGEPRADIAEPFGSLDVDDLLTFLDTFATGCP